MGWYRGRWKCTECGFRMDCDSERSADKHIMGIGETLRGVGVVRAEEVFRWDRRRVRLKAPRGGVFRKVRRKRGRGWRLFWLW